MADESAQEKRHEPSERKWREAAERGQVPKSGDISSAAVLLAGAAMLVFGSAPMGRAISRLSREMFQLGGPTDLDISSAMLLGRETMLAIAVSLALPLGGVAAAAIAVNLVQTKFQMGNKAMEPKWDRLDAFQGFKQKYLSPTPLVELVKGLGKLVALSLVIAWALRDRVDLLPALASLEPIQVIAVMKELAWAMVITSLPLVLAIAAADYGYAYYQQHKRLKRTDKELKDENKDQEGDPHMRAHRKARARQIALGNAIRMVSEADVVVTNPTHYAVALRYRRGEDEAPVVLAKGVDHLALRMRTEALRHGVPRMEDRPLARALYAQVDVGHTIPEDLYGPVARVLAVVMRRRAERLSRR